MITRICQISKRLPAARPNGSKHCLFQALFSRADFAWKNGDITSAKVPFRLQDPAIFKFHDDGILLRDGETGELMEIDHEGSSEDVERILHVIESFSLDVFGEVEIKDRILFMPGSGLAKLPHTLALPEIMLCICAYFHVIRNYPDMFIPIPAFREHLKFDQEEFLKSLAFYLLYRVSIEDQSVDQVMSDTAASGWRLT